MSRFGTLLKGFSSSSVGASWAERDFWSMPSMLGSPLGDREKIESSFEGYVQGAYKANGIVYACILARLVVFAQARFQYQQLSGGRPGNLFGDASLALLEAPWPNGTTGELLARMEQDGSLAGNFFATARGEGAARRVRRLRPDWVTIVTGSPSDDPFDIDAEVIGYLYEPQGGMGRSPATLLTPAEVVHWSPLPDPEAQWRGMSWITPVVREILADSAATKHKLKFFENGATSNMVVSYDKGTPQVTVERMAELFKQSHEGVDHAYKTIHLGGGADARMLGADLQQLDFKVTQGGGEPLALDTPVPTPSGWSTMGALVSGDFVFGRSGKPVEVLAVSPVHLNRRCYRVTFNDHTSVVADEGHLWAAMDRNTKARAERTYTTEQLAALIAAWKSAGKTADRIAIPAAGPVELAPADLLIDPYVLGAWLGDGQTAGAAICGAEDDLVFIAAEIERRGYTVTRWKTQADKVPVIGVPGGLLSALAAVGVLGDKHIPSDYLRASIEQRLDLLRGLMDTDGTVGHVGSESCEFSSKYEALALQVADLCRSLGIRTTVSCKVEPRSRTGSTWRVTFRADPEMVPFLLPRKVARCQTPVRVRNRAIVSIEPVDSVPVRCITVDSPDHLFRVGEGWALTHNTRIAAASGVGAIIAQFSEGMAGSALNAGNYGAARRRFGDMTMQHLWQTAAASLSKLVTPPPGSRLWVDSRDIPFLKDDAKDAAEVLGRDATTVASLIAVGYKPDDVVKAVAAGDLSLLSGAHSGLFSVQLQSAGAGAPGDPAAAPPGR